MDRRRRLLLLLYVALGLLPLGYAAVARRVPARTAAGTPRPPQPPDTSRDGRSPADSARRDGHAARTDTARTAQAGRAAAEDPPCLASHLGLPCA